MQDRITYPDDRPGMPPLIFDDEFQRERVLLSLAEAIGNAEMSLPVCENPTAVEAAIGKLKRERDMAEKAPTLLGTSSY